VTYTWTATPCTPPSATCVGGFVTIAAGATFDIDFASWNNAAFATFVAPPLVPEPGTLALLGGALVAFGIARRRKSV
jgi:hypothetical protein